MPKHRMGYAEYANLVYRRREKLKHAFLYYIEIQRCYILMLWFCEWIRMYGQYMTASRSIDASCRRCLVS